jgi:hypothetical protein
MKCLNPACEGINAQEFNVSLNSTETAESIETEYTGDTEYGTWCDECHEIVFRSDWKEIATEWVNQYTILLRPDQDPWTALCTKCANNTVPAYGMECLECEA